jgi:predicted DCC family thiol-disulfide oxidoreductase YuxK
MTTDTLDRPICYYNGACPVCRFEIEHYKDGTDGDRVRWLDLAADPEALARFGIDRAGARRRLHVLDEEGRLHVGIDAFILIWQRMPRYRWLGRVVGARPLRPVAAAVYDHVLAPLLFHWNKLKGRI